MKWRDDYKVGIKSIDEQHKMLFQMSADYRAALHEERGESIYGGLLKSLKIYCRGHFSLEERCMEEHKCPVADKNKEAHASLLKVLASFEQRYEDVGFNPTDAMKLVDTLDQWLNIHICRIDVHLRKCVNKK